MLIIGLLNYLMAALAAGAALWFNQIAMYLPISLIFVAIGAFFLGAKTRR